MLLLNNYAAIIYAQEATPSAAITSPAPSATPPSPSPTAFPTIIPTPTGTPSATITPTISPEVTLTPSPSMLPTITSSPTPTLVPTLPLYDQTTQSSAVIRQPIKMSLLSRDELTGQETMSVQIFNAQGVNLKAELINNSGDNVPVVIRKKTIGNEVILMLDPPPNTRPGKYTLKVTDELGHTEEQSFIWGVLAINTNKSIYLPNETADIAMAVLDNQGEMVCDAKVTLHITNNSAKIDDILSTDNGKIVINPDCKIHDYTLNPDYEAHYQVGSTGTYNMDLTAVDKNGTHTVSDAFEVRDSVAFDVERQSATRIYPLKTYPVKINILANQDFTGTIKETVPENFTISPLNDPLVTKYDASGTATLKSKSDGQNDNISLGLRMPFDGNYPIDFNFGETSNDPFIVNELAKNHLPAHDGVDFGVPMNTPIKAVDDGKILAVNNSYGNTIVIQHSWGKSIYGHLDSIKVTTGQAVKKGDVIGLSGETGYATGPHLHFGIEPNNPNYQNGYYGKVDPLAYLPYSALGSDISVRVLSWNVSIKKGDKLTLGYQFLPPAVSPQFYLLGPLSFVDKSGSIIFTEMRQWQIAADAVNTFYMTTTAGSSPYPTTSNLYSTTSNSSSDVTTFAKNAKNTGFYQFQPSVTNTTSLGTSASSLPTTPTNNGWINTGTQLDGQNTPSGTWTIGYIYSVIYTHNAPTTKVLWYRVLKVTCSGGTCTQVSAISPTDASAPSGSGWAQTTIGTIPSSGTLSSQQTVSFTGASTDWASGEKLYVEFAINTNSTSNNSGGWELEQNTSSDYISTPNSSAISSGPSTNQLLRHGEWFDSSGVRQPFTF